MKSTYKIYMQLKNKNKIVMYYQPAEEREYYQGL